MRMAFRMGARARRDDYVNAHGTATREGDPIEIAAIRGRFRIGSAESPSAHEIDARAHAGRNGVIEASSPCCLWRRRRRADRVSRRSGGECTACATSGGSLRGGLRAALSNSFAFGGSNTVLAFRAFIESRRTRITGSQSPDREQRPAAARSASRRRHGIQVSSALSGPVIECDTPPSSGGNTHAERVC